MTKLRGLAAIKVKDSARAKAIAAKGGASVPAEKRAFARDPELASRAGRLGGLASKGGGRPKNQEG